MFAFGIRVVEGLGFHIWGHLSPKAKTINPIWTVSYIQIMMMKIVLIII